MHKRNDETAGSRDISHYSPINIQYTSDKFYRYHDVNRTRHALPSLSHNENVLSSTSLPHSGIIIDSFWNYHSWSSGGEKNRQTPGPSSPRGRLEKETAPGHVLRSRGTERAKGQRLLSQSQRLARPATTTTPGHVAPPGFLELSRPCQSHSLCRGPPPLAGNRRQATFNPRQYLFSSPTSFFFF